MKKFLHVWVFGCVVVALSSAVQAQKTTAEGIAEYRAMLADGNPAELFEAKGAALWKQARGSKNVSLEKCDLGKGAGGKAGDKIAVTWVDNRGDKRTDEAVVS